MMDRHRRTYGDTSRGTDPGAYKYDFERYEAILRNRNLNVSSVSVCVEGGSCACVFE